MLLHVRVDGVGVAEAIRRLPLDPSARVGDPARSHQAFADASGGPRDLTAVARDAHAAGILVLHREVIEDVPVLRLRANLTPSHAERLHRR